MGKFPFKRPRIISKNFSGMNSPVDGVSKSLNDLVFSYSSTVDKALQKKHWLMAISSIVLLIVLGSFISPKGKAESSIFYPDTCLGGWINPHNAEGKLQTTSNGDESQFTKNNSAVLPKNTNAEMYCGSFKGKFETGTKPTKIVVSLAMTKGGELQAEDTMESGILLATTTEITASSTVIDASSTLMEASSTSTSITEDASSTATSTGISTAQAIPSNPVEQTSTVVNGIIESINDTFRDLFESKKEITPQTDTVIIPPPVDNTEQAAPPSTPVEDTPPTSYVPSFKRNIIASIFQKAFAEEASTITTVESPVTEIAPVSSEIVSPASEKVEQIKVVEEFVSTSVDSTLEGLVSSSTQENGTSTIELVFASSTPSSTDITASTTEQTTATTTEDNQFQNNFLEVFYTFDGVTWTSLGELNEISMKYRTFEIPVTASTSWEDLGQLQMKVVSQKHELDTPTVYLDGIKVEVLYENVLAHMHPDFARDTILKDEIVDRIRIVTLVNHETNEQEVWYMYLDELSVASSTIDVASSTLTSSTTELVTSETEISSTTSEVASSTNIVPIVDLLKREWKKYLGKDITLSAASLVEEIKKQELEQMLEKENVLPDFASDTIKRIKGVPPHFVLVQLERPDDTKNELWLYDIENSSEERIDLSTTTLSTVSPDAPIGIKGQYIFWLSVEKETIYAYNFETKILIDKKIPVFDPANGERAEINFDGVIWKVILSGEGFSFDSAETGEVFSDEDSYVVEMLRTKVRLDEVLDTETLNDLNLPVSADLSTSTTQ